MPMLRWKFGFPIIVLLMVSVGVWMLFYFRRKGWVGAQVPKEAPDER